MKRKVLLCVLAALLIAAVASGCGGKSLADPSLDASIREVICEDRSSAVLRVTFDKPVAIDKKDYAAVVLRGVNAAGEAVSLPLQMATPVGDGSYASELTFDFGTQELPLAAELEFSEKRSLNSRISSVRTEDGACLRSDSATLTASVRTDSAAVMETAQRLSDGKTVEVTFAEPVTLSRIESALVVTAEEGILHETPGELVNVLDFGAIPDDEIDDVEQLQAAVDAVKDGGTVFFPAGEYLLSKCLVFYSYQTLYFEPGAVLKITDPYNVENGTSQALMATYMDGTLGGYDAIKNVNLIGATFDGNAEIDYANVMLNTCHIENLNVINCTFRNGRGVHYYECNSGKNLKIIGCVFEDSVRNGQEKDEHLQIDRAGSGAYSSKYSVHGKHTYVMDNTPCENVLISDCEFYCSKSGVPALGNHAAALHRNLVIQNCTFVGGNDDRGIVVFGGGVKGISFSNNTFADCDLGIDCSGKNTENLRVYESNQFEKVDRPLQDGMEFTPGDGEIVPLPKDIAVESVAVDDGFEVDGEHYGNTLRITFAEPLPEDAQVVFLQGAIQDSYGNGLKGNAPHAMIAAVTALS